MRTKNLFVGLLLIVFLTFPVFSTHSWAQEDKAAKLIEGAKKEGEMVFYTTMNVDDSTLLVRAFEKKYPFIKTKLFRLGSEQLLTKMLTEKRAGVLAADVVSNSIFEFSVKLKEKIMGKYISPEAKAIPEGFKDPEGYWASLYLQPFGIAYNTKLVSPKDTPKGYEDLLNPKWKGKMSLDSGDVDWFAGILHIMGKDKGLDYMNKLGEQDLTLRKGHTLLLDVLIAGEHSIDINAHLQRVERYRNKGAPIDWLAPEPALVSYNPMGITVNPPHPHAAMLFLDFALSKEGQKIVKDIGRPPARADMEPIYPRLAKFTKGEMRLLPLSTKWTENYEEYSKQFRKMLFKKR